MPELDPTYTLENLKELNSTFQKSNKLYSVLISGTSREDLLKIQASTVEKPLDELIKLVVLIHSNVTKIGLVFKYPLAGSNYNAAYKQLQEFSNIFTLLISVVSQINLENKYSKLLKKNIVSKLGKVFLVNEEIVQEIGKVLEFGNANEKNDVSKADIDAKNKQRLVAIGKLWNACDEFQKVLKEGEVVLLNNEIKQSNKMVNDAVTDLEEWIENPEEIDDDPFGINDFSDVEDDNLEDNNDDDTQSLDSEKKEDEDAELEDKIKLAKVWLNKIKLIKLLFTLLSSTLKKHVADPASVGNKMLNEIYQQQFETVAAIDELVSSLTMGGSLKELQTVFEGLVKTAQQLKGSLESLNKVHKSGNEKAVELLESWNKKFAETI